MNERIRKLAVQASEWYEQNVSGKGISGEWETKFAELIVRECTAVGSQWADGLIDENHYAFVNKKIKQHFGVEE
jgi:hypothetical protein